MRILHYVGSLLIVLSATPVMYAEIADDFLKAYFFIQDGDSAEKAGDTAKAVEKYSAALKILREIKRTAPDWNQNIIAFRGKYCAEHILKAGIKIDSEGNVSTASATPNLSHASTVSEPTPSPVKTTTSASNRPASEPVATTLAQTESRPASAPLPTRIAPAAVSTKSGNTASPQNPSERITSLEKELQQTRIELNKVREEKLDLESRLKKTEEELRSPSMTSDERVQALLKENNALKQKLSETEAKLNAMPSSSTEITSLREELAKTQAALEMAKKQNGELLAANESLKKDLEETRNQLKLANSGPASSVPPEVLQTLQKENALLRSIVDQQFQEDAKRMVARDALSKELRELGARTDAIRTKLEVLQTPLSPLTEDQRRILRTPGAALRVQTDNPNKISGVVLSPRTNSMPASSNNLASATAPVSSEPSASKLSTDNAILAADAKRLFAKNDIDGAATKYEQILKTEPDNLFALSNLGVIRFRQDKIEEAEKNLKAVLAMDSQDAFSLAVLGIVYYRQEKYDEAISTLTRAISITPDNHEAHNYLGITYSQKGYQEAAEKELLKAIELKPDYGDAHFNLAVVYASQTPPSIELARKHYKQATDLGMAKDIELEKLLK